MAIKIPVNGIYDINVILNNGANDAGVHYFVLPSYSNILSVNQFTGVATGLGLGMGIVEARDASSGIIIKRINIQVVANINPSTVVIQPQDFATVVGQDLSADAQAKADQAQANAIAAIQTEPLPAANLVGLVPNASIPPMALTSVTVVANGAARLALTGSSAKVSFALTT